MKYANFLDPREVEEIRQIRKALEANSNPTTTDIAALTQGGALSRQWLDGEMVAIVSTNEDFRFLKSMPTRSVDQTLAEFTKQSSHGTNRHYNSSFVGQSDNPKLSDAQLKRLYDEMCYLSEGGIVNKAATIVKSIQDPELVQQNSATNRLMQSLATNVWYGDKTINSLEFSGFAKAIKSAGTGLVYDCRGSLPGVDVISDFVAKIRTRYFGLANQIWYAPGTRNLVNNTYQNSGNVTVWQNNNQNPGNISIGNKVKGYLASEAANDGELQIMSDLWLDRSNMDVPRIPNPANPLTEIEGATGPNAPAMPSFALASVPVVVGSLFDAPYAGLTGYRVAAVNKGECSVAAPIATVTSVVGGGVTITITPADAITESFKLYRETKPGSGIYRWFADVARAVTPTTVYTDLNFDLPGMSIAVMGDFNSRSQTDQTRTFVMSELMPLLKTVYPYGIGGVSVKQQLLSLDYFCVLQFLAIEKFVLFTNVPVA